MGKMQLQKKISEIMNINGFRNNKNHNGLSDEFFILPKKFFTVEIVGTVRKKIIFKNKLLFPYYLH